MKESLNTNRLLWMGLGLIFHGTTLFFSFDQTYDGFVHMFFADHYARDWFDNWDYRWYTGFTVTSYPPLIHQVIALLSKIVGLKIAFILTGCLVVILFIRGVYVFSNLFVKNEVALLAAFMASVCPSFVEALHIFGQLPSITGISLVLNATPLVYFWTRTGNWKWLLGSLALLATTSSAHHVSTIFGMVFFLLPVMGTATYDLTRERVGADEAVTIGPFIQTVLKILPRAVLFGGLTIGVVLLMVFPYWAWSHSDPITQVPIPHGSRDDFLDVTSSGLVFFLIPWGIMLLSLSFIFKHIITKRNIFLGLALMLGFLLGTGGTTPLPRMLLGDTAFDILTLDRFTFWSTILSIPFWALFVHEFVRGSFKNWITRYLGDIAHQIAIFLFAVLLIVSTILVINMAYFRPLQPASINVDPITQFLERDGHDNWRYLTLGFGDQMAWLAANTHAMTVDGNYHSVRRLPELTTRAVERLENSKYRGIEGLGALQDFLGNPKRYHLKFIFNNDKFYEPLLFYYGWNRVQQLENSIVVWEKPNVPPLPKILFRKSTPRYQQLMWGILPLSSVIISLLFFLFLYPSYAEDLYYSPHQEKRWGLHFIWILIILMLAAGRLVHLSKELNSHHSPENLLRDYYHALDFKKFSNAYFLFNPDKRPTLEQYTLDLSLQDGILSSYAKLDAMEITDVQKTDNGIRARVSCRWITSLEEYKTSHIHYLQSIDGKWYLDYPKFDKSVIPERYLSRPSVDFYKSGKRKSLVNKSFDEDEIERPEVCISNASVRQDGNDIYVVGMVENTSPYPANISITAKLFDRNLQSLNSSSATHLITHRLLPGQYGPFRIDFKMTADSSRNQFDPKQHPSQIIPSLPDMCQLSVSTTVSEHVPYMNIQNNWKLEEERLSGSFINTGSQSVSVPQLLISYFENEELSWVDANYLQNGVGPLKSQRYQIDQFSKSTQRIFQLTDSDISINGKYSNSSCSFSYADKILITPQAFVSQANE